MVATRRTADRASAETPAPVLWRRTAPCAAVHSDAAPSWGQSSAHRASSREPNTRRCFTIASCHAISCSASSRARRPDLIAKMPIDIHVTPTPEPVRVGGPSSGWDTVERLPCDVACARQGGLMSTMSDTKDVLPFDSSVWIPFPRLGREPVESRTGRRAGSCAYGHVPSASKRWPARPLKEACCAASA